MNTHAIHMAMRLEKFPEEMAWLCFPDSDFPEGMSDLLRILASEDQLIEFADKNGFESTDLTTSLFNFIEKAMLNKENSNEKLLGTDKFSSTQMQNFHYKLLMKIYHPDLSKRPNAEHFSALITKAYQGIMKKEEQEDHDVISFSESRAPLKRYHQTSKKAESQISYTKSVMAVISAFTIILLVSMAGKFYHPANPEITNKNKDNKNIVQSNSFASQKLMKVTALNTKINLAPAETSIRASSTAVQALLKELEVAYEKGDVDTIKPILANAPEIKEQTEKQLNDKLETIFQITRERKMVLFDFNWKTVSGKLEGKGKFLSRYQLIGEKKWLTREGTALVSAKKINNKLKITQLILENQTID